LNILPVCPDATAESGTIESGTIRKALVFYDEADGGTTIEVLDRDETGRTRCTSTLAATP
jgi:hypothetical protein